ncbi:respiratory nitrate reductase subunit gamma [Rhodoblastus sp.]|jgi:nitrate reductase gamma subunit|uniref:respiratory nitrate reductase subunit gamma n=1 Tax=Rhodoblastus sp. TaxID=1962975 RepID=UPI002637AAF8|nr:respiratory nitrate reductase subunit gamma [Rhodoblastus sp.]
MLTIVYATAFYAVSLLLIFALGRRIWLYATTPAPLKIPTTPAPLTKGGVALRMLREVTVFQSLFRANKWIWLFGWIFHVSLAVVLLRHLRYFLQPVPLPIVLIQPFGVIAGFAMVAGLLALWARRFVVERIRYISGPSDHLILALLVSIGLSGLTMKFLARTDIVSVKEFFLGLMYFDWRPLPADPALIVHLTLVLVLMVVFPFSKLLHAPGVFFSPSRNQADDTRERRYVGSAKLESTPRRA